MRTRRPEEERREEILSAGFRVAARDQLAGLSMRAVAEEAGVSKGLVFFYFDTREKLLLELLAWMLAYGPRLEGDPWGLPADAPAGRRLLAAVRHEVAGLPERRARVELFLEFWVMGLRRPEIRARIRAAFDRYRGDFLPYAEAVVAEAPERFGGDGARGVAAAAVSFIEGCALQVIADPEHFDVERYMLAVRGLVMAPT